MNMKLIVEILVTSDHLLSKREADLLSDRSSRKRFILSSRSPIAIGTMLLPEDLSISCQTAYRSHNSHMGQLHFRQAGCTAEGDSGLKI